MGLFILAPKRDEDCTALELVESAEKNIALWKKNPACDYLLDVFAANMLQKAANKIKDANGDE